MRVASDFSASTLTSGFVATLVGVTSSIAVVFEAARGLGANEAQVASWVFAIGVAVGGLTLGLSLATRMPIMIAWSTPGAAVVATTAAGGSHGLKQATGAFVAVGVLTAAIGFTGWFCRLVDRIPMPLASALLAGVLTRFGVEGFVGAEAKPLLVVGMFAAYLIGRRWLPRSMMLLVLITGVVLSSISGDVATDAVRFSLVSPEWVAPSWSVSALLGIGVPLFIVTMAGQNLPGVAVIRTYDYPVPVDRVIGLCGATSAVLSPFGCYAVNLAAISAAICMGPGAHEDRDRRYTAAVTTGALYLVIAALGTTITSLLLAFPTELVRAIAGLALIGTISANLRGAVGTDDRTRDAAVITFLVTVSGVTLAQIGSAFWGAIAGVVAYVMLPRPTPSLK